MRRFYVPGLHAEDLSDKLAQALEARGVDYAVTHEVAAQRYAPFLSSVSQARCRLIAGPAAGAALADLSARPVAIGSSSWDQAPRVTVRRSMQPAPIAPRSSSPAARPAASS